LRGAERGIKNIPSHARIDKVLFKKIKKGVNKLFLKTCSTSLPCPHQIE
jgi:hypothetical protein